ncbi:unnamed protein product, partial [Mesorhabditis spiculigera]
MRVAFLYLLVIVVMSVDSRPSLTDLACERRPELPYCKEYRRQKDAISAEISDDKFKSNRPIEKLEGFLIEDSKEQEKEEVQTLSPVEDTTPILRSFRTTRPPRRQPHNILFTLFPTLQKDHREKRYCPANQYTFQVTCAPQKKLRYDLQVFCQEYADICGVPNTNLYPSRTGRNPEDEGRPEGYGQKQKNGNFGMGNSFAFGTGMLPGFSVVSSQGADIGHENLPFFNQIGGMMINNGMEIGATGKRIGQGPARTIDALDRGFPTGNALFGGPGAEPSSADRRATGEFLRSFGIPNVAGLGKILKSLNPPRPRKQLSRGLGYEPGYGALNKKAPFASGKVDHDSVNLPGGIGDFEINKGVGFGVGK